MRKIKVKKKSPSQRRRAKARREKRAGKLVKSREKTGPTPRAPQHMKDKKR